MRRVTLATMMALIAIASVLTEGRQLKTPPDWKWRTDTPASVVDKLDPVADEMTFVAMPPGWHVTTGPGALLYHPGYLAKGNFAVEADIFLFPGDSPAEYGVFLGGQGLDRTGQPAYLAFVARRDGQSAILRSEGPPVSDWRSTEAIAPHPGKDAAKLTLRVDVSPTAIVFSANGKEVAKVSRAGQDIEGQFGFRIGKGMNVHASRLDITHKLAPVPVK